MHVPAVSTQCNTHNFVSYPAQNTLPADADMTNNSNNKQNNNNHIFYANNNSSSYTMLNTFSSHSTPTPVSNTTQTNIHLFNYSDMLGNYNNKGSAPSVVSQLSPTLVNSPVSPVTLSSDVSIPFYDFITVLPYYIETCLLLNERDQTCR